MLTAVCGSMVLNIAERSVLAPGSARGPYTTAWVGCRGADLGGRAALGGGSKKPVFLGANFGVFGPPQG